MNTGALVGGVVGALCGAALLVFLFCRIRRNCRSETQQQNSNSESLDEKEGNDEEDLPQSQTIEVSTSNNGGTEKSNIELTQSHQPEENAEVSSA